MNSVLFYSDFWFWFSGNCCSSWEASTWPGKELLLLTVTLLDWKRFTSVWIQIEWGDLIHHALLWLWLAFHLCIFSRWLWGCVCLSQKQVQVTAMLTGSLKVTPLAALSRSSYSHILYNFLYQGTSPLERDILSNFHYQGQDKFSKIFICSGRQQGCEGEQ